MTVTVRGVPAPLLAEAVLLYVVRRPLSSQTRLKLLLSGSEGRSHMTDAERRNAAGADATLRRLGVRCFWRAAIVTELLRRRGISARVRLFVDPHHPRRAHAECQVDDQFVREPPGGLASLTEG